MQISQFRGNNNSGLYGVEVVSSTSYSGGGTIGPGELPATTALTVAAGATVDLNGCRQTVASLNDMVPGAGGVVTNTYQRRWRSSRSPPGGASTFSGTIQDASGGGGSQVALVLNGTGTQILNGVNTYTGGTTIGAGCCNWATRRRWAWGRSLLTAAR